MERVSSIENWGGISAGRATCCLSLVAVELISIFYNLAFWTPGDTWSFLDTLWNILLLASEYSISDAVP